MRQPRILKALSFIFLFAFCGIISTLYKTSTAISNYLFTNDGNGGDYNFLYDSLVNVNTNGQSLNISNENYFGDNDYDGHYLDEDDEENTKSASAANTIITIEDDEDNNNENELDGYELDDTMNKQVIDDDYENEEYENNDFGTVIETSSTSNATILSDIINITHIPTQQKIIIHFKDPSSSQQRQCYTPIVRGRLSGPLLSIIEFKEQRKGIDKKLTKERNTREDSSVKEHNDDDRTDYTKALIGTYNVPLSGMYYVEIIGILCNHKFDIPSHDFKRTCLISPVEHRLTASNASIYANVRNDEIRSDDIESTLNFDHLLRDNRSPIGYWKRNQSFIEQEMNEKKREEQISPLYTRYQPLECRTDEEKDTPRCDIASNTKRFNPYDEFEFSKEWKTALNKSTAHFSTSSGNLDNAALSNNKTATICIIGWSHSRHLVQSIRDTIGIRYGSTRKLEIPWIKARYPHDLHDINFFYNMQKKYKDYSSNNCTHVVVGLGQWPGNKPMLFDEFDREMKRTVDVMKEAGKEMGFKSFLRSIQ